jgi:hypothetical protein
MELGLVHLHELLLDSFMIVLRKKLSSICSKQQNMSCRGCWETSKQQLPKGLSLLIFLYGFTPIREPKNALVGALACHQEVMSRILNRCKFFSDLIRTLGSTQPEMGTEKSGK